MIGNKLEPFKFWCQKVLPNVYDDSLSYYEYLCKLNEYLNEVIEQINTLTDNMEDYESDLSAQWTDYKSALNAEWLETKNYIDNYFNNLNVQQEINNKLDQMATDGSLSTLLGPVVATQIGGVVAEQIGGTVAQQIDGAVAGQIDASVASQIGEPSARAVDSWLNTHISQVGSSILVDDSLLVYGAGADSKTTGDIVRELADITFLNLYDTADSVSEDTYVDPTDGTYTADANAFFTLKDINVTQYEGQKLYPFATTSGSNAYAVRSYAFYNKNKQYITGGTYVTNGNYITVLDGAYYISVSVIYTDRESNPKVKPTQIYLSPNADNIPKVNLKNTVATIDNKWNLLVGKTPILNSIIIDGVETDYGQVNFFTYKGIEIKSNTVYALYNEKNPSGKGARYINYYNSLNEYVSSVSNPDEIITTPSSVSYMSISFVKSGGDLGVHYLCEKNVNKDTTYNTNGVLIKSNDIQNNFGFIEPRRPIISFIIDDDFDRNARVRELIHNHNYVMSFAIPYTCVYPNNTLSTYKNWVKEGDEILCHGGTPLTDNVSESDGATQIYNCFKTFDKKLIKVNGFIGSQGLVANKFIPYLKKYYKYAATQPNHAGVGGGVATEPCIAFTQDNPFKLWRYSMQLSTLQEMKDAVDECIQNNSFLWFYGHARSDQIMNMSDENIEALLAYIDDYVNANECTVLNATDAINNFYSFRYDDLIS